MDRRWIASGIFDALEQADIELRVSHKRLFKKVDKIKSRPDWVPFANQWEQPVGGKNLRIADCPACGRRFVSERQLGKWAATCSQTCQQAVRRWRRHH